jgi:hypothetical protein
MFREGDRPRLSDGMEHRSDACWAASWRVGTRSKGLSPRRPQLIFENCATTLTADLNGMGEETTQTPGLCWDIRRRRDHVWKWIGGANYSAFFHVYITLGIRKDLEVHWAAWLARACMQNRKDEAVCLSGLVCRF